MLVGFGIQFGWFLCWISVRDGLVGVLAGCVLWVIASCARFGVGFLFGGC